MVGRGNFRCLFLVSLAVSLVSVHGQAPCKLSEIVGKANLNMTKFLGLWYEVEWISPTYDDGGDAWVNYYHVYKEDAFGVVTGYYSGKDPSSGQCFLGGLALLKTPADPAKLIMYEHGRKTQSDYWILETDYTSYAVVYSCMERETRINDTCKTSRSWLWGRTTSLPADVKSRTRDKFKSLCMNMTNILVTSFKGNDCVPENTSDSWVPLATLTSTMAVALFSFLASG